MVEVFCDEKPANLPNPAQNAREALDALIASVRSKRKRQFIEYAKERIDLDRFAEIQTHHLAHSQDDYMVKYFDLAYYLNRGYKKAIRCELHKPPKALDILDLGCGPGYFGFAAGFLKHRVIGLDLPSYPLVDELTSLLGVSKLSHAVQPLTSLPPVGRFDLITAFCIAFHHGFGREEWNYFLRDLKAHLNPDGRIRLQLNVLPDPAGLDICGAEFARLIAENGGEIDLCRREISICTWANPPTMPQP